MALAVRYTKAAWKDLDKLDAILRERVKAKITEVAAAPYDVRHSKPLVDTNERSARVGDYRVLLLITGGGELIVSEIGARGGIYRRL